MKRFVASALLALPFAVASLPTQVFAANVIEKTSVQTQVSGREGTLKTPVSVPYSVAEWIQIRVPIYGIDEYGQRVLKGFKWVQKWVYTPVGHNNSTKG